MALISKKYFQILLFFHLYFYFLLSKCFILIFKPAPSKGRILYLAAFYPHNAGSHWRVEKWAEYLREKGYNVDILYALNELAFNDYNNNPSRFLIRFLRKRFFQVLKARHYEIVIVRREVLLFNEYGNLFLEKLLRKLSKHLILDFDDDLSASKNQPRAICLFYPRLMLANGNSFRNSFSYYDKYIVASSYLKALVKEQTHIPSENIAIIPTCVDYDKYPAKDYTKLNETITLGWIGGDHNYTYLHNIITVLNELAQKHTFRLMVIGGQPFVADAQFPIINKKWSLETEVEDLYQIDVGLMPLDYSDESKGKGGFKLIQYMGLGIVSVAQDLTINKEIAKDGEYAFLAKDDADWYRIVNEILNGRINFEEMGRKAKKRIENSYTFNSNFDTYLTFVCVE
ncbi:MAG: glycosyltransferase family 4 protein [Flavobacteriales bacterium]|nr:glycosyltransferase family 4 protein [Flavobacteriales bacterium]